MALCPFIKEECTIGNKQKTCVFELYRSKEKKEECALLVATNIVIFNDDLKRTAMDMISSRHKIG